LVYHIDVDAESAESAFDEALDTNIIKQGSLFDVELVDVQAAEGESV
jgi:hypothetical protein